MLFSHHISYLSHDNQPINTAPARQSTSVHRPGYDYTTHPRGPASHISHVEGALVHRSRDSQNTSGASHVSDDHRSNNADTQQTHHNLANDTYSNERSSSPRGSHHDKRYLCPVCRRAFSRYVNTNTQLERLLNIYRPSAVEAHMPTHTGERRK